jgi:hypothetical protein
MRIAPLVLAALFSATVSASAELKIRTSKEVEFVIPADSPVRYLRTGQYDVVHYSGQFVLSGRFSYGHYTDDPKEVDWYNERFLTFEISSEDAKRLPYWTRDGAIRDIQIRNPDRFAAQIIGKTDLELLRTRKINHVSGRATILVKNVQTQVECDHQYTSVEFVSVSQLFEHRVATRASDEAGGC